MRSFFKIGRAAAIGLFFMASPAVAEDASGTWSYDTVKGVGRFWAQISGESTFSIWCKNTNRGYASIIDINLKGQPAPSNSSIRLSFDGDDVNIRTDGDGNVRMDCHFCADQMTWIWWKFKTARKLRVSFKDGRAETFGLISAKNVMGKDICSNI